LLKTDSLVYNRAEQETREKRDRYVDYGQCNGFDERVIESSLLVPSDYGALYEQRRNFWYESFSTWVKGIYTVTNEPAMDVRAEKRRELDGTIFRIAGKPVVNKLTRRELLHARSRQMSILETSRIPSL
jgi:hypothetical protein